MHVFNLSEPQCGHFILIHDQEMQRSSLMVFVKVQVSQYISFYFKARIPMYLIRQYQRTTKRVLVYVFMRVNDIY